MVRGDDCISHRGLLRAGTAHRTPYRELVQPTPCNTQRTRHTAAHPLREVWELGVRVVPTSSSYALDPTPVYVLASYPYLPPTFPLSG